MTDSAEHALEDTEETGWDRRKKLKTAQIVEAATNLFLSAGFGGVSMDKVVEAAGVSKRTLYNYYENKEHLFIDVIQAQLAKFWPSLEAQPLADQDASKQLEGVAVDILQLGMSATPLALYRIVIAESQRFPELAQRFYEFSSEQVIERVHEMLSYVESSSDLKFADSRQAAEQFMDLLTGTAFMRVVLGIDPPMSDKTIRKHAARSVRYFIRAYSS